MKEWLRCESKKYAPYFFCVTAFFALVYALFLVQSSQSAYLWIACSGLFVLAFVNPVVVYSFKMSDRGTDGYYCLPIKRRTLFAVKTFAGLFLTLAPFTVAYFFGAAVAFCRMRDAYDSGWYFVGYPCFLFLGSCLFGINAFVFTRANRVFDGVLFMAAYAFLDTLVVLYVKKLTHTVSYGWWDESFSVVKGIFEFGDSLEDFLLGKAQAQWRWWVMFYPFVVGGACYAALYVAANRERAERVGAVSESPFGYRFLIPTYTALCIGGLPFSWLGCALIVMASLALTAVYRRSFSFSWKCWVMFAVGVGVGAVLLLVVGLFAPPLVNPPDFA